MVGIFFRRPIFDCHKRSSTGAGTRFVTDVKLRARFGQSPKDHRPSILCFASQIPSYSCFIWLQGDHRIGAETCGLIILGESATSFADHAKLFCGSRRVRLRTADGTRLKKKDRQTRTYCSLHSRLATVTDSSSTCMQQFIAGVTSANTPQ